MKILPPVTFPAEQPLVRRHAPPLAPYGTYRQCLRWEFGFTCAFCLLHEADFIAHGVEGTGLTSIEHLDRQGAEPGSANIYENCYYACRFCNRDRGTTERTENGKTLLDPCADAWSAHFECVDDELKPRGEKAVYTHDTYRPNAPRKKRFRQDRRELLTQALRTLREMPALLRTLREQASVTTGGESLNLLDAAQALRKQLKKAQAELKRWIAIPADQSDCSCDIAGAATLPAFLASQLVDVAG